MDAPAPRIEDRLSVSDVVIRYATGVDSKAWDVFASCFTDPVEIDYSSTTGDPATVFERAHYVAWLGAGMSGYDATQHISANHVVTFTGDDAATCVSYMQATHVLDGQLWVVGGYYTNDLVRSDDGWRIRRCHLTKTWEWGDLGLRARAHARGAQRTPPDTTTTFGVD